MPDRFRATPSSGTRLTAPPHEHPVFLDQRGRRRRLVTIAGWVAGIATALWLAAMLAGASGFASLPAVAPLVARHVRHLAAAEPRPVAPIRVRDADGPSRRGTGAS